MPGVVDHAIAALLVVVWPLWVARHGRDEMKLLAEEPSRRLRSYWTTVASQWAHAVAILAVWGVTARPWSDLGLERGASWGLAFAAGLAVLALGAMRIQWVRVRRDPRLRARLREQVREVEGMVPTTRREVRAFRALAVTAGISEELAYRGFLLWYLGAYMPLTLAIVLMVLAFGASHLYQGRTAAVQVAGIGAIAALFYLLSGSLWIPIVLHIVFDLFQLALVRATLAVGPDEGTTPAIA